MRRLLTFLIASLILTGFVDEILAQDSTDRSGITRPNIVLLLADDLGYGKLGCQGNPQIATPHIDSIAKAGVRFTSGYVTAPYCSASRAGLMTSPRTTPTIRFCAAGSQSRKRNT